MAVFQFLLTIESEKKVIPEDVAFAMVRGHVFDAGEDVVHVRAIDMGDYIRLQRDEPNPGIGGQAKSQ